MSAQAEGRGLIYKGDRTTTGGVVTSGVGNVALLGKGVTQIKMIATCPVCEKGQGEIIPKETIAVIVDNVQVALHGDIVACDCPSGSNTLIASAGAMKFHQSNGQVHGFKPHANPQEMEDAYQSVANSIGGSYLGDSGSHLVSRRETNNTNTIRNGERFRKYFPTLLEHEGGFVDDPDDLGGATNKGITYRTLQDLSMKVLGLPPSIHLLKSLTDEQAYLIYKTEYWDVMNGDDINDEHLAFQIFDFKMNAGNNAIETLQQCLKIEFKQNIAVDGYWGKNTLKAVNNVNSMQLYVKLREYRIAYYKRISKLRPRNEKYLKGWINRANSFNAY